jgi:hypothetical protein
MHQNKYLEKNRDPIRSAFPLPRAVSAAGS